VQLAIQQTWSTEELRCPLLADSVEKLVVEAAVVVAILSMRAS
jgi:hypothetical protein